jgi:hypothetical protein
MQISSVVHTHFKNKSKNGIPFLSTDTFSVSLNKICPRKLFRTLTGFINMLSVVRRREVATHCTCIDQLLIELNGIQCVTTQKTTTTSDLICKMLDQQFLEIIRNICLKIRFTRNKIWMDALYSGLFIS